MAEQMTDKEYFETFGAKCNATDPRADDKILCSINAKVVDKTTPYGHADITWETTAEGERLGSVRRLK